MKKFISIVLAAVTALTMGISAFAAPELQFFGDNSATAYFLYTQKVESSLSISSRKATCKSVVTGIYGKATKIVVTQRLRKKVGNWWTYVETWEKTYYTSSCIYTNTKSSLATGNTYDVETVAKVYSGTKNEQISVSSNEVTI